MLEASFCTQLFYIQTMPTSKEKTMTDERDARDAFRDFLDGIARSVVSYTASLELRQRRQAAEERVEDAANLKHLNPLVRITTLCKIGFELMLSAADGSC